MLSQVHVRALRESPSAAVRADVAAAVAAEIAEGTLSAGERGIAVEILEILARDADRRVRQALAEHVKQSTFLPRDIAVVLANDIEEEVALPIIQHSPLLRDTDLIALVRGGGLARWVAVAQRRIVPGTVADALIATDDIGVISAVIANAGAELSERTLLKIVGDFGSDPAIGPLLVERAMLPLGVIEALIARVSQQLRDRLVERHRLPPRLAEDLVRHGRERALLNTLSCYGDADAADRLAARLHARRLLTSTLLLRALCAGDLGFFEAGMATLASLPTMNARGLIYDRSPDALRALYRKAALPPELLPAFRVGVNAVLDGYLAGGRAAYEERVVSQMVLAYNQLYPGSLEQVLEQLAHWVTPPAASASP